MRRPIFSPQSLQLILEKNKQCGEHQRIGFLVENAVSKPEKMAALLGANGEQQTALLKILLTVDAKFNLLTCNSRGHIWRRRAHFIKHLWRAVLWSGGVAAPCRVIGRWLPVCCWGQCRELTRSKQPAATCQRPSTPTGVHALTWSAFQQLCKVISLPSVYRWSSNLKISLQVFLGFFF